MAEVQESRSVLRFGFLRLDGFLDFHVVEFLGIEDLATLQTLNKFSVVVPGNDTYSWVFANRCHRFRFGWIGVVYPFLHS